MNQPTNKKLAYAALAVVSFFWGTTYLVSRVAVQHIPGLFLAGVRNIIAGGLIVIYFLLKGECIPDRKTLIQAAWLGFVLLSFSSGLSHWSVQYISGGLAAIIGATIPLWMVFFSVITGKGRKISFKLILGLLFGFAGIAIVFYDHLAEMLKSDFRFGIIIAAISSITWAAGSVYTSKIKLNTGLFFGTGLQMLFAGVFLTIASLLLGQTTDLRMLPKSTWYEMFYLVFIGSIITYSAYIYAIQHLPPARVAIYAYINPVVAIILGNILMDERLNGMIIAGTAVTILGVYIVNSSFKKSPSIIYKNNDKLEIIEYESQYQHDFFRLNKSWIEKDFPLEEIDILVLSKPEEYILKNGGAIVLAILEGRIVGTCALKKTSEGLLELTKMAVDENYRGRKIGELLGHATIAKAKQMGASKIELYFNRITSSIAVKLYLKLGFREVYLTPGIYKRANIKMEMDV